MATCPRKPLRAVKGTLLHVVRKAKQLRFTAAMSKAMSKELAPLLAGRDPSQARPSVYRGSKESSIDGWVLVMHRYLQRTQAKATPDDNAWSIISHLEGEDRNYIINKAESERDTPEKVFELLASRFGSGGNRMQVRQAFATRQQFDRKDWMQYSDALEGLRSQGFPDEPVTTRRKHSATFHRRRSRCSPAKGTLHFLCIRDKSN